MFIRSTSHFVKHHLNLNRLTAQLLIFTMLMLNVPVVPIAQAADIPANLWVSVPVKADPMMQGLNISASAATQGMWSGVNAWPIIGVHVVVLPDGRLLTYGTDPLGGSQNARFYDVWDPSLGFGANSHITTSRPEQQNSFCSTSTFLSNGNLMITGGNGGKAGNIFTPSVNAVTPMTSNMNLNRWYSTMINLPDGRPIILGGMVPYSEGMVDTPDQAIAQGLPSMTPEVYENGTWRSLLGAYSRDAFGPDSLRTSYPRAWVAPDGRIFGISADKMWYLDPNGNGSIPYVANFKIPYNTANPVNVGATNTAVMFAPGKILQVGGNGGFNGDGYPASDMATVIDINGANPVLIEQPRMSFPRRYPSGVVLADGKVVITGGTKLGNTNGPNAVYVAEIWNPATSTWSVGASAAMFRSYHSQSALLPNGTVFTNGSGTPGPVNNLNAEIYYPPYLFKNVNGASQLATRPVIKAISGLSYLNNAALQLDMDTTNPISQLVLIGTSQGTHSFNAGQRRIPLNFTQSGIRVTSTTPNANLTPPGYYQVVALDASGVPSLGTIIAIGQNQTPPAVPTPPYTPPNSNNAPINAPVVNSGAASNYTVTASAGFTYSWNFGDGSVDTPYSANASASHAFAQPGAYVVTLSAKDTAGIITRRTFMQAVSTPKTANSPNNSSPIVVEKRTNASNRIWVVNPDNDSVSVIDDTSKALVATINVGTSPRTLAVAPDGRIWVTNKGSATISIINPTTLAVAQTINLPRASQPHGIAFTPTGGSAFVVLEATGQLLKLDPNSGAQQAAVNLGNNPRHLSISADGATVLVSRFITPPLPGESTATIDTAVVGGEVHVVNPTTMTVTKTVTLRHSDKADNEIQGSGIPNYLAAPVISPDGTTAWVPSKQDNIKRGVARNAQNLNFQNTIRAISSRINMSTLAEDYAKRVDHDNSSLGSAAVYHPSGVYMFVALESSRQVAVVDAIRGAELFKINVGRAPQGLAISPDGNTLYVQEFMDRSVSIYDLSPLTKQGLLSATGMKVVFTVAAEKLPANVVLGKQLFYDAKDPRLARDSYMSCASCHNDGGHDGRVWDLTGFGEGLRNTIALKGRAGMGHGLLHWSANFDEVQDFEGQIRALAGGTGLMTDAQFNTGTRNQPLGDKKAGVSADLDNLAAYVGSLNTFAQSPNRNADGTLTAAATAGKTVFNNSCASCHTGSNFTNSKDATTLTNIGTINPLSGKRLNAVLTGLDVPTLRDIWATAPYLHNGSAATIPAAIQAHTNLTLNATDLVNVAAYVQQVGSEEVVQGSLPTGVAASWNFDGVTGTTVADTSGNSKTLTLGTGTTITANGLSGGALQNNGINSINGGTAPDVIDTAQSFSVSGWMRFDQQPACWNQALASQDGVTVSGFSVGILPNCGGNPARFAFQMLGADRDSAINTAVVSNITPVNGKWYHLVAVRDVVANTMSLYVDGQLVNTVPNANKWSATGAFAIGRAKFSGGLRDPAYAAIDAVNVYARALNTTDVASLFQARGTNEGTVPPTVSITAPTNNASFTQGGAITLSATAADSDGSVVKVDFYDGATLIGTDATAPYSISWANAGTGNHAITAKATDNAGAMTTSAIVNMTVNAIVVNKAPTVAITVPTANQTLTQGAAYTVTATASDSDGTVARVDILYNGENLISSLTTAPYTFSGSTAQIPVGTYIITARAYDDKGAFTTSAPISITVAPSSTNKPPTVAITAPANNVTLKQGDPYTFTVTASDSDGTIVGVELLHSGTEILSTLTSAPYTFTGSTAQVPLGTYSITARARDSGGAVTTSAPIIINIVAP